MPLYMYIYCSYQNMMSYIPTSQQFVKKKRSLYYCQCIICMRWILLYFCRLFNTPDFISCSVPLHAIHHPHLYISVVKFVKDVIWSYYGRCILFPVEKQLRAIRERDEGVPRCSPLPIKKPVQLWKHTNAIKYGLLFFLLLLVFVAMRRLMSCLVCCRPLDITHGSSSCCRSDKHIDDTGL